LKRRLLYTLLFFAGLLSAQTKSNFVSLDSLPSDLPVPIITTLSSPDEGYIFAAVPYWGTGGSYLVMYNNQGRPVFFKKTSPTSTDFKLHDTGVLTYFDASSGKFFALDSTFAVVDSFWVQNGYVTDEHDIKILGNGNVLLIGYGYRSFDMSKVVVGGDPNATVVVNVVQEIDRKRTVVFEWRAYEHFKFTDVGPEVNLLDPTFVHTHVNSVDLDLDGNLVISSRNLDEITKIDRRNGDILWRFGGRNNQFTLIKDSLGFSAQHSVSILPNGNLMLFDNGVFHVPHFSRAVEYKLDTVNRTATLVWSYRNTPDIASIFWGNAQRLKNGDTFIGWGKSDVGATEVNTRGEKVFEMSFPRDVYSYRVFRFAMSVKNVVSNVGGKSAGNDIHLQESFPNPFNGSTAINYQLPGPGVFGGSALSLVRLTVYDLLGRQVEVLVNEQQSPGLHSVLFAPKSLPSGVFVYRLQAGNVSRVGKMLYLK
jgi:hypothetical protein